MLQEIKYLEERIETYRKVTSVCPECGQKVEKSHIKQKLADARADLADALERSANLVEAAAAVKVGLEDIEEEIEAKENKLVKYNEAQGKTSIAAERSIAATQAMHREKAVVDELKERVNPFVDQCSKLEARVAELKKAGKPLKERQERLGYDIEIYKFWQKGFREIRLDLIDTTLLELEIAVNHHAETLGRRDWEIGFATERENKTGGVSHGFSVFLYPPNRTEPVSWDVYSSGGEGQRWELATTFGLAEVLLARSGIETDIEVLDEPTTHLSEEGIEDLLTCLRDRARELNRRIFLIDQINLNRGSFDGVLTVRKTADGMILDDVAGLLSPTLPKKPRVRERL